MKGYKGYDKDFKCRGFQYEVGKTYMHDGTLKMCQSGFHFVENPLDVFGYYEPGISKYSEVEADGVSDQTESDSKRVAKSLHIGAELSLTALCGLGAKFILDKVDFTNTPATNTGYSSAATNTGDRSAATNTGNSSAATNTGYRSAATNTGNRSAATNTGNSSAATNTGNSSAATNTGNRSAATNTGYSSAATNTGYRSAAKPLLLTLVSPRLSTAIATRFLAFFLGYGVLLHHPRIAVVNFLIRLVGFLTVVILFAAIICEYLLILLVGRLLGHLRRIDSRRRLSVLPLLLDRVTLHKTAKHRIGNRGNPRTLSFIGRSSLLRDRSNLWQRQRNHRNVRLVGVDFNLWSFNCHSFLRSIDRF